MDIKRDQATGLVTVTFTAAEANLKSASPSTSGKTLLVDTGNAKLPCGAFGNLTVQVSAYIPNPAFKAEPKGKVKAA